MTLEEAYRNYYSLGWITLHKNGKIYISKEEKWN